MAVTCHAIILLLIPVVTLALCVLTRRKSWGARFWIWAVVAWFISHLATVIVSAMSTHLCDAGDPDSQALIIGLCVWLVLIIPRFIWIRPAAVILLLVALHVLSDQYARLVHEDHLTGNPAVWANKEGEHALARVKARLKKTAPTTQPYGAGWVDEMPFASSLDGIGRLPLAADITPFWHSWYSGLYGRRTFHQDYWFPGGQLPEAADRITLKERMVEPKPPRSTVRRRG